MDGNIPAIHTVKGAVVHLRLIDSAVPHITLVKGNIEESTFLHLYILHFRLCKKRPFKQARNELATGKEREGEITGREIAIYESAVQERR